MSEIDILSLAGNPVWRALKRVTLEIRVVRSVRLALNPMGYRIDSIELRKLVYSRGFASRLAGSRAPDDDLVGDLAGLVRGSRRGDTAAGVLIRDALTTALRSRLAGSSAASDFHDDRSEARTAQIIRAVESQSSDEALFEHRVSTMHPVRASDLRSLKTDWPGAARWLGSYLSAPDKLSLLRRWAASPPTFQGAPVSLFGILADLAADQVGLETSEASFIEHALAGDIDPQGYWAIRLSNVKSGLGDRDSAITFLEPYRGYPLVDATLNADGAKGAISVLEAWKPPTDKEDLLRALYLTEYYLRTLKLDEAIAMGEQTYERFKSTSSAILAARALTFRHMTEAAVVNRRDLPRALSLAVQARADRLRWGVHSGAALALETRIRRLLSDYRGAFDLMSGGGEIPTTPAELSDPEVIAETAKLQAERGDVEIAKRLVNTASEKQRSHILALIAEREDRNEDALEHWLAALDDQSELGDKADIAIQIAFHGVRADVIDELRIDNPGIARELEMTAALFGHAPNSLEEFRGFANAQYRGALYLYVFLQHEEDEEAAAAWAREAAAKWSDSDLWMESARYFGRHKDYTNAIQDINAALLVASEDWGGRSRAFRMLVEAHSNSGDWAEALTAAASLLADEPDNPSAAWAVVICQARLNDLDGALRSWQLHGSPEPQNELEVAAWIELLGKFGSAVGDSRDALAISNRFPGNEQLRGSLLSVMFFREKNEEPPADDSDGDDEATDDEPETLTPEVVAFREMLASYVRDFPEGAIRQISVDIDDPLAALRDQFRDVVENPELEEQLSKGMLPIGLAAEIHGKHYLEALTSRDVGPVFAGSTNAEAEADAIAVSHAKGAVIDLSALVSIAHLPQEVRALVSGHFATVRGLTEQQRDAMLAVRTISRDSGLSYRPARGAVPEGMQHRTTEELAQRLALATEVEETFSRLSMTSHPRVSELDMGDEEFDKPFLLAADLAVELEVPLWADDVALKEIMRGAGGMSFGTPELLQHLRAENSVDADLVDLAEATLITKGYAGLRFRAAAWELAASLATTHLGLANAIRHSGGDSADERYATALALIDAHATEPEALASFVFATAQWLESIAPTEEAATQNLVALAREVLGKAWMSSSALPYCVDAFRHVSGRVDGIEVLLREIYRVFESIANRANDEAAATVVFELVSRLDAADGLRVRSGVLARRFV